MNSNNDKQYNKLSNRYEIIEQVGVGGMSYVYKAFDTKLKRIVAIKMLKDELSIDDDFVKKFKSEAIACKDIKHKNVISAYDVVDEGKMHYIVMEYVEGTALNKYINSKGKLSNEETIEISLKIANGIRAAHNKGIIHRDIKPQNIVIDSHGEVKITDFGIARAITSTTKNISVIGTVHYISPEQVRNTTVDFRSDIYSFGCTMYEMITGVVPFEGETPVEIIISHLRNNIENPRKKNSEIYLSLEKIILKATRMIPRERYQSIDDMILDLEKALVDKDGTYIKENVYDDKEGETVIITDEDMKIIKAVSEKYTNKSSYRSPSSELTKEQKEFIDRYIENGSFRQHRFIRRIIVAALIAVVFLIVIMMFIALDTRKPIKDNDIIATESVTRENVAKLFEGLNVDFAKNLAEESGLKLKVVDEVYSDTIEYGKIVEIKNDNTDVDDTIDVVVSKGSEIIDFTDKEKLQNTRFIDMQVLLNERELQYTVSDIYNNEIKSGYIIGVNKNNSGESGPLVFTVSQGTGASTKKMPYLENKPINEVRDLLEANELLLGGISYIRSDVVKENYVISQSIKGGEAVNAGTKVDLYLSCGVDGVEYIDSSNVKWHGEISKTYNVGSSDTPDVTIEGDSLVLQVRLMQTTSQGIMYTELMEPTEYKKGTILPIIFKDIEGEANVETGSVQVVDVVNDKILFTVPIQFHP